MDQLIFFFTIILSIKLKISALNLQIRPLKYGYDFASKSSTPTFDTGN
jgi:hypothetical protein